MAIGHAQITIDGRDKLSKKSVVYAPAKYCGRCAHFESPNHCTKVTGAVQASGWCNLFTVKGKA